MMAMGCMDKLMDFLYPVLYHATKGLSRIKHDAATRVYRRAPKLGDKLLSRIPVFYKSPSTRKKEKAIDRDWLDSFAVSRALDTVRVIKND